MSVRPVRQWALIAVVGAMLVAMGACSSSTTSTGDQPAPSASAAAGEVIVFAAASLQSTFTKMGALFEDSHPGATVRFNFAGSSDLLAQLQQGAPADVFAAADTTTMDRATADKLLSGPPTNFATNTMMIAVPPDNPAGIATFADLAEPGVQVVVCAPQVPCGAATKKVEASTGVTLTPVSEESSVADVLNKVSTGEADAGVVYATDVQGATGKVTGIDIPTDVTAVNTYPIGVLAGSAAPTLAGQFKALVTGRQGQQVLADAGFGVP